MSREDDELLARAIAAARAEVTPGDQTLARQTRSRLRQADAPAWWQATPRLAWAIAGACFVVAPLGWAAATGRLMPAWQAIVGHRDEAGGKPTPSAGASKQSQAVPVAPPAAPPSSSAVVSASGSSSYVGETSSKAATKRPRVPTREASATHAKPDYAQQLFATAHELHFRGGEPGRALQAWDAYLAFAPRGEFAVEARYNRALALLRLGRRDEAALALAPFAAGHVAPAGYRRREAAALIEALRRDASTSTSTSTPTSTSASAPAEATEKNSPPVEQP